MSLDVLPRHHSALRRLAPGRWGGLTSLNVQPEEFQDRLATVRRAGRS